MVQALIEASKIWANPTEMIAEWEVSESKMETESIVSGAVGYGGYLADLGCGVGRYCKKFIYDDYAGFDNSLEMVREAKVKNEEILNATFCVVDIFNFQSDHIYDTMTMIDVAYHQDNPIEAILTILKNWKSKRYFFTLLVGNKREELYNSVVLPFTDFFELIPKLKFVHSVKKTENDFAWVLFECIDR